MTDSYVMPTNDILNQILSKDSASNKKVETSNIRSHFHGAAAHSHVFPILAHQHNNGALGAVTSTGPRVDTKSNQLQPNISSDTGAVTKTPINTVLAKASNKKLNRTKAIIKKYNINDAGIKGYVFLTNKEADAKYPGLKVFALLNPRDRKVYIADRGYKMYEGGYASLLGHEIEVHFQEQLMKKRWYSSAQGDNMQEVEAYMYQLKNSDRFGMQKGHYNKILHNYLTPRYDALDKKHKALVDRGVFHYE